jgi:hypothetical protein
MSIEPHTPFDFAAVEADRPGGSEESRRAGSSRLVLDAILGMLLGKRLSLREIGTRTLALSVYCNHWRIAGKSRRQIAARVGLSKTALNRVIKAVQRSVFAQRGAKRKCSTYEREKRKK